MMPPEVMDSVAGTLITKQVLREIVRRSVRTPSDEHYFAVVVHKGVSDELQHLTFKDLAKILGCSTSRIHTHIAEHMLDGSARGGCKVCNKASKDLRKLIVEEKDRDHASEEPFSLWVTVASISREKRRSGR